MHLVRRGNGQLMSLPAKLLRGTVLYRRNLAAEHPDAIRCSSVNGTRGFLGSTGPSRENTECSCRTQAAAVNLGLLRFDFCLGRFVMTEPKPAVFDGDRTEGLAVWLQDNGVDVSLYGVGTSKTVAELFDEVQNGESVLHVSPDGVPMRTVRVLSLLIRNSRGEVLIEEQQVRPNGSVRSRGLPLSEKLVATESWRPAVERAIKEELGSILPSDPKITVDDSSYRQTVESSVSVSYPQLRCQYQCHRVEVQVEGLPNAGKFVTVENCKDGVLQLHWAWRANWQSP